MSNKPVTVAFVCVQNAGRSQMASAFARVEKSSRNLNTRILTGGTDPADEVHPEVVEVMKELDIDLSQRKPREIKVEELHASDYVITMGCGADEVCPYDWCGDARDWNIEDPHGKDMDTVRTIRDDINERVSRLFDELESNKN